ncbi:hypothetical protein [Aquimarina agarilytica]|uniref:hypothetical protein n=1 Tax=Aquimarina agarilytica TaxID=1087449 RepID=UPI0002880208|nr:hypothetical protein [Aquimarina agarilytica]
MKRIEHQLFLKRNQLEVSLLLQPIQEKIEIFNRMQKLLDTVSECEKGNLLTELEALDLEIVEDIEEEYADRMEFNEIEEAIAESKPVLEEVKEKPIESQRPMPKKPMLSPDERILEQLIKSEENENVSRSKLKKMGLVTPLGWDTTIGQFRVVRTSVFRYRYSIVTNFNK